MSTAMLIPFKPELLKMSGVQKIFRSKHITAYGLFVSLQIHTFAPHSMFKTLDLYE
jgi:hypothetical protein